VHPQWPDNKAFDYHQEHGEIDKAFAEADVIVKQRITSQRLIPTRWKRAAWWRSGARRIAR
jgi:CO/xanthine dehydrogenase Mo-binding subunit